MAERERAMTMGISCFVKYIFVRSTVNSGRHYFRTRPRHRFSDEIDSRQMTGSMNRIENNPALSRPLYKYHSQLCRYKWHLGRHANVPERPEICVSPSLRPPVAANIPVVLIQETARGVGACVCVSIYTCAPMSEGGCDPVESEGLVTKPAGLRLTRAASIARFCAIKYLVVNEFVTNLPSSNRGEYKMTIYHALWS